MNVAGITRQQPPECGAQIVYCSHGGGPLPILGEASHVAMVAFMRRLPGGCAGRT